MIKNIMIIGIVLLLIPEVNGQAAGPGPTNPNCGIPFDTVNPVGGAVLGQIRFCLSLPLNNQVAASNSAFNIGAQLTTPVFFPLLATVTTTLGFTATAGCSLLGNAVSTSNVGTGAAIGFQISTVRAFTMSASVCYGYVEAKLTTVTPAVTYFDYLLPFVITANDAPRNQVQINCGSSSTLNSALPYINPCSAEHVVIDSWPTLLANVTNSGTVTVINGGGQNVTISGNLNTSLTGALNLTLPNGVNVTVTSIPQITALLNITSWPTLNSSCGNTSIAPCYVNSTEQSMFNGTINSNITNQNPPDYRSTATYTAALWTIILFILAIAVAEWKKDLMYHLIAVIIGIYGIVNIPDVLGVERMVIIALMIYQIMRIFRIYRSPRNSMQTNGDV